MPDVEVTLGAQDAELVAAWQRAKMGPREMAQELDRVGKKSKAVDSSMASTATNMIARYGSAAAAVALVTKELRALAQARREVRGEETEVTEQLDTSFRQFRLVAQFDDRQAAKMRAKVFEVAKAEALPVTLVSDIGRQLVSADVKPEAALEGGIMQAFAAGMKTSGETPEELDPRELVEAVLRLLANQAKAEDREFTPRNIDRVLRTTNMLGITTQLRFPDLSDVAKAAPAMAGAGLGLEDQLIYAALLRQSLPSEEAGVGIRNISQRMGSFSVHANKTAVLDRMGVDPKEVDAVGESLETALRRLQQGVDTLPEDERAGAMVTLFEDRGRGVAEFLMNNVDKIAEYRQKTVGVDLEQPHDTMTTGFAAEAERRRIEKQRQRFGGPGAVDAAIAEQIEISLPESPASAKRSAEVYRTARDYGVPREFFPFAEKMAEDLEAKGAVPERQSPFSPERQAEALAVPMRELRFTRQEWELTDQAGRLAQEVAYREGDLAGAGTPHRNERIPFLAQPDRSSQGFGDYVRALVLRGEASAEMSREEVEALLAEKLLDVEGLKFDEAGQPVLGKRLGRFRERVVEEQGEQGPGARAIDETIRRRRAGYEAEESPAAPPIPPQPARPAAGDSSQLLRALDRNNRLLEQVVQNTRDPTVTIKNPTDPDQLAGRARARPAPFGVP